MATDVLRQPTGTGASTALIADLLRAICCVSISSDLMVLNDLVEVAGRAFAVANKIIREYLRGI